MRPISEQVGRTRSLYVEIRPTGFPPAALPATAVADISFIPSFREHPGVTGYARWCPAWSRLRDLVLAGRPNEALAATPPRPTTCGIGHARMLGAVIHAEAGDERGALAALADGTRAKRSTASTRPPEPLALRRRLSTRRGRHRPVGATAGEEPEARRPRR